jgi:hypothetical protein
MTNEKSCENAHQQYEEVMKVTRMIRIVATLCILSMLTLSALAQKVNVDWDRSANFQNFRTYAWGNNTHAKNPLMDQRIIQGIESQLAAKGLQKVTIEDNPDLVVRYHAATETETQLNTIDTGYGPGWRYGWGGMGSSTTYVDKIPVGNLIVDIGDVKDKKYIWRGTASGTISSKPEKNEKTIDKALTKMFEKYPPPLKK